MNYRIETAPSFDRAVKRLAKKYRRLKRDLRALVELLAENLWAGVAIPGFSHAVWKVRLASSDMQVGKGSGYRVIYIINQRDQVCYLLFIYAKSARTDITPAEIEELLADWDS